MKYFRKWSQSVGDKGVTDLTTRDTDPGRKGVYSVMSSSFKVRINSYTMRHLDEVRRRKRVVRLSVSCEFPV